MSMKAPTFDDVVAAARRLDGVAHRTPVFTSRQLDRHYGASIYFKCENFQRAGAFKFRGAYNAISRLDPARRAAGVVTFSSGNHAQAIALAAKLLGVQATVFMPNDAPLTKKAATQAYGANIVEYDRQSEDREQRARQWEAAHGATLIPPFDHPDVIAGQGTSARELLEETGPLDMLFVPLGGGGLLAGCLLAAAALSPDCAVYGVEPEAGDDGLRSFRSGQRVCIAPPQSIADGALTPQLGALNFDIIRRHAHDIRLVSDDALARTMRFFAERMKIIVEPTGCLGAAALAQAPDLAGKRIGVVLSGGNIDLQRCAHYFTDPL